ncbi:nitronate monooxygenase [Mycoplasmatota bacterium]|nr:nitronate monooxygenase [Mycoplasmatota bacterium]
MKKLIINNKESKYPIIQGGMGIGISLSRLSIASIKAGIVGTISAAQPGFLSKKFKSDTLNSNLEALAREIKTVRDECPDGILGVNVMYAGTNYDEYIKFLSKQEIDFIVSGAGLPVDLPKYLKGSSVKPAVIVSSGKAAKIICKKWMRSFNVLPEFVVVEGPLAGGHLGFSKEEIESGDYKSLETLLEEVLIEVRKVEEEYKVSIPVIPAGGISTGEDVARYIEMGSAGVQVATRFIATEECDVSDAYKQKIVNAREEDVIFVPSPVGLPGRAIRNAFTDALKTKNQKIKYCVDCLRVCAKKDIPYCITEKLGNASGGDAENGLVFSGAKAYMIDRISTVKEIVEELISECKYCFE